VPEAAGAGLRLDKWLWQARFFRARSSAAAAVAAGQVRLNGIRVTRPGKTVRPGDTLTFVQGGQVRVVRVLAVGLRRGPAAEARTLWCSIEALSPAQQTPPALE
jgi:ribosome-associated heat shock protein Hsp15